MPHVVVDNLHVVYDTYGHVEHYRRSWRGARVPVSRNVAAVRLEREMATLSVRLAELKIAHHMLVGRGGESGSRGGSER